MMLVTILLLATCAVSDDTSDMNAATRQVAQAAMSVDNQLATFRPTLVVETTNRSRRHTPLLQFASLWKDAGQYSLEVPEYSWARVPGDPYNQSPFFYGRPITTMNNWSLRYPSLEEPRWKDAPGGALHLDVPLEGGYTQRFRVIPHDRMVEVRFGITNESDKPLTNLRCQLCMRSHQSKDHQKRWPTTSSFLSGGERVTWDSLGQDLSWLDAHYNQRTGRFSQSCFFLAPQAGFEPAGFPTSEFSRADLMWYQQAVDVPIIAKTADDDHRHVLVYSPHGRTVFYNALTPCFHADPHMDRIESGETRWTTSYILFFEGDVTAYLAKFSALHKTLARRNGYRIDGQ